MHRLNNFLVNRKRSAVVMIAVLVLLIPLAISADDQFMLPPMQEFAYEEITDEQLQQFGLALVMIQQIELNANEMIQEVIETSPISEERLQEILMMYQADPAVADEHVSKEDMEVFEETILDITDVQQAAVEEMVEAVEHYGFEIQEFNQIVHMINESPELLERLQEMFDNWS